MEKKKGSNDFTWLEKQKINLRIFQTKHPKIYAAGLALGGFGAGIVSGRLIDKILTKNSNHEANDIPAYVEPTQIQGETDKDRMIRVIEFSKTLVLQDGEEYTITKRPDEEYEHDKGWYREMFGKELSPNEVFHISAGDD